MTANKNETTKLLNAQIGQELMTLANHNDRIYAATWSPGSQQLVVASLDKETLMIDNGTLVVTKEGRYDICKPFPEEKK